MRLNLMILLTLIVNYTFAQIEGPIPVIETGYGSRGEFLDISVELIANDHYPEVDISVHYPSGTSTPVPTIFYAHGYMSEDTINHIRNLKHFVTRGYAVVFVPYQSIGATMAERYTTLFDGFTKAARELPTIIDTTRVGFLGHSFGGGATPRVSYRAFTENNREKKGKFIYCSAPWYSYELGTSVLSDFPSDCNMLIAVYDDDDTNDHRMGMDIFNNIAIDDSNKDFIIVYSNTVDGYDYIADHTMPNSVVFNALDCYVMFRLVDALADYSFTGNLDGKDVALGNGSTAQIDMGGQLLPLSVTDDPSPVYEQSKYMYPCSDAMNERQEYCQDIVSNIEHQLEKENNFDIYPNPTTGVLNIKFTQNEDDFEITIYNQLGETILKSENQAQIDLTKNGIGIYFVSVHTKNQVFTRKIIKTK